MLPRDVFLKVDEEKFFVIISVNDEAAEVVEATRKASPGTIAIRLKNSQIIHADPKSLQVKPIVRFGGHAVLLSTGLYSPCDPNDDGFDRIRLETAEADSISLNLSMQELEELSNFYNSK